MRYLARIRTHRLSGLLDETDLPVGVSTTKVGWRSGGHAARRFIATVGISPSDYRRTAIGRALTETSPWLSATQGSPESTGLLTTGLP